MSFFKGSVPGFGGKQPQDANQPPNDQQGGSFLNPAGHPWGQAAQPQPDPNAHQGYPDPHAYPQEQGYSPAGASQQAHDIDYVIQGSEMQFVEVELDPGESAIAEAGSMMFKDVSIAMETIFGDGSAQSQTGGFFGKLVNAGKRVLTGESLFMTQFTHMGEGKARVAFAAPYPGKILPMWLPDLGGTLICQKDSFLCGAKGVQVGIAFQKKIMTGLFGGEGFIMQRMDGDGMVFIHAGGTLYERTLEPGEMLHVDTGCVVAYTPGVDFDIVRAGNIKSMIFGGEGLFFAQLTGPGHVWLQSLPFSRLAGRVLANLRPGGGSDEGSVLGGLGNIFENRE